jgi:hypothetical protein
MLVLLVSGCKVSGNNAEQLGTDKPHAASNSHSGPTQRIVHAEVVALELPLYYNRFGSVNPYGMIYALKRDVIEVTEDEEWLPGLSCPSKVRLQTGKRPRPLTLRGNAGDILEITFTNQLLEQQPDISQCKLLDQQSPYAYLIKPEDQIESIDPDEHEPGSDAGNATDPSPPADWPKTRSANIVIPGLTSLSGSNPKCNGLQSIDPGESITCQWKLEQEGTHLFSSHGAPSGGEGDGGSLTHGLFGVVIVEPENSTWYRSQITASTLDKVWPRQQENDNAREGRLQYDAVDANGTPYLNMLKAVGKDSTARRYELIYGDLNAVILDNQTPDVPAFREFTVVFHDELKTFYTKNFQELPASRQLSGVGDGFAINYGASGMGSILLANRKEIGPAAECAECFYEEFFLQSWANGDPALLEHFDDDPSNVAHSYLNDRVKFRNLHAGPKETHVFHLHAHQWLSSGNSNTGTYLDSQTIAPQQGFDYSIYDGGLSNWGSGSNFQTHGSGNRNRTVGDSIFHCHLYPHFAQGMWALWRVHDVIEDGTRKLPDGQPEARYYGHPQVALSVERLGMSGKRPGTDPITGVHGAGTPIPAVLPLPGQSLPPLPTYAQMPNTAESDSYAMPGYPFYIPGEPGRRAPQPPLDFAKSENGALMHGGLPRHIIKRGERKPAFLSDDLTNRLPTDPDERMATLLRQSLALGDFRLELTQADITLLDHEGEPIERQAMDFHAGKATRIKLADGSYVSYDSTRSGYPSLTPEGRTAHFHVNGASPAPGAPYADPCHDPAAKGHRNYEVSAIGLKLIVNRAGWHDPQARINVLTKDAEKIEEKYRHDMEPFFFRAASGECIEFKHQNRTKKELELDDFQVATPTDTIGQHIHLVKFDVTSSDGSGNGFNYEDGTFSRGAVEERIAAASGTAKTSGGERKQLTVGRDFEGRSVGDYQTTVQRWFADPLLTVLGKGTTHALHGMHGEELPDRNCPPTIADKECFDRTLRTAFTHDHFAPSSIQQHGFYSALLVEPAGSRWLHPNGEELANGVGSKAVIVNADDWLIHANHREFALAVADFALLYEPTLYKPWLSETVHNGMARLLHESANETSDPLMPDLSRNLKRHAKHWWKEHGKPVDPPFKPEAISKDHHNPYLVNYRHEPIPLRIGKMEKELQIPEETNCGKLAQIRNVSGYFTKRKSILSQKTGLEGDLMYAFATREHGDPCSPILEAYEGEKTQIRLVQGAQEVQHTFSVEGLYWPRVIDYPKIEQVSEKAQAKLDNPLAFVAAQEIGISEHAEMAMPIVENVGDGAFVTDYLYHFGTVDSLWNGAWGLLRVYNGVTSPDPLACEPTTRPDVPVTTAADKWFARRNLFTRGKQGAPISCQQEIGKRLQPLPGHGIGKIKQEENHSNPSKKDCPSELREVHYKVVATRIDLLVSSKNNRLFYEKPNQIFDPDALILLAMPPVTSTPTLKDVQRMYQKKADENTLEPLVLRANANDCIKLDFYNLLTDGETELPDSSGDALMPKIVPLNVDQSADSNAEDIKSSTYLSISIPMLPSMGHVNYHNIGIGMNRSLPPAIVGGEINLRFYAGRLDPKPVKEVKGKPTCKVDEECLYKFNRIPYAFGTIPIKAFGDVIGHGTHGLFGTLIIEPEGATYHDPKTGALIPDSDRWALGSEALIKYTDEKGDQKTFREFVIAYQDGLNLHWNSPGNSIHASKPIGDCPICDDSYDHGEKALNYRTAPFWARLRKSTDINGNIITHDTGVDSDLNRINFPNNFLLESWAPISTPVFRANVGEEVRFRVSQPHGRARQRAFVSFGHDYVDLMPNFGSAHAALLAPGKSMTATFDSTKEGCYLYRDGPMHIFAGGVWGHFRVKPVDGGILKCEAS